MNRHDRGSAPAIVPGTRGTLIQSFGDGSRWLGPVGNIIKAVALNALAGQTLKSFTAKVTAPALTEVSGLIESGRITPVIDRAYPLTEAAAAVALVALTPAPGSGLSRHAGVGRVAWHVLARVPFRQGSPRRWPGGLGR